MIFKINRILKSYWLKNPNWGLRRIIFIFSSLLVFIIIAWLTKTYILFFTLSFFTIAFVVYIFKNIQKWGFYHRLLQKSNSEFDLYDFILPSDDNESLRVLLSKDRKFFLSRIYLKNTQKRKKSAYLDIVRIIYEKTINYDKPASCLYLGGGGCSIPLYIASKNPLSQGKVVEINPEIAKIAKKYFYPLFGKLNYNNLQLVNEDAKLYIKRNMKEYDFIFQDISIENKIPNNFLSPKWINTLSQNLKNNGVLVINLGTVFHRRTFTYLLDQYSQIERETRKTTLFLYTKVIILLITNRKNTIKAMKSSVLKKNVISSP